MEIPLGCSKGASVLCARAVTSAKKTEAEGADRPSEKFVGEFWENLRRCSGQNPEFPLQAELRTYQPTADIYAI